MSKTLLFLLLIFIGISGFYIWLRLYTNTLDSTRLMLLNNKIQNDPTQSVSLAFSPTTIAGLSGKPQTVKVLIQTNDDASLTLIQLELSYDPSMLGNLSVTPGPYFSHPSVPLDTIDPVAGRISYALEEQDPSAITASDIAAYITFTPSIVLQNQTTKISFLPKSIVEGQTEKNLLNQTNNLIISISPGVGTIKPATVVTPLVFPQKPLIPTPAIKK